MFLTGFSALKKQLSKMKPRGAFLDNFPVKTQESEGKMVIFIFLNVPKCLEV